MLVRVLLSVALFGSAATAAPIISAVVNAAKYGGGTSGDVVSPGSLATVFGTGFPAINKQVSAFPLTNPWEGVTVKISTRWFDAQGYVVALQGDKQMTIFIPSNIQPGTVLLTITVGSLSSSKEVAVVANNLGLFSLDSSGGGAGVLLDPFDGSRANSIADPAAAGASVLDIWATGLGAAANEEINRLATGPISVPLEVYIGGVRVPANDVLYQGRSGCCIGVDQIRVRVPAAAPNGCHVPVTAMVNGHTSNTVTMAIGVEGGVCHDADSLPADVRAPESTNTFVKQGRIFLSRTVSQIAVVPGNSSENSSYTQTIAETANAVFSQARTAQNVSSPPNAFGQCLMSSWVDSRAIVSDVRFLDAGPALKVTGPEKDVILTRGNTLGWYLAGIQSSVFSPGASPLLQPGRYTMQGQGGADVGAFVVSIDRSPPLVWNNQAAITTVDRRAGLTLRWSGGSAGDRISISGVYTTPVVVDGYNATVGAILSAFTCYPSTNSGLFTIPAAVLLQVPAASGTLNLTSSTTVPFSAPGLDQATVQSTETLSLPVKFQ